MLCSADVVWCSLQALVALRCQPLEACHADAGLRPVVELHAAGPWPSSTGSGVYSMHGQLPLTRRLHGNPKSVEHGTLAPKRVRLPGRLLAAV